MYRAWIMSGNPGQVRDGIRSAPGAGARSVQELALPVLHIHVLCRAQVDRGTPAPTLSPTCRQPRFHWRSPLVTTTVPRLSGESTGLAELVEQRARVSA